jgi:DnaK suppressor protein
MSAVDAQAFRQALVAERARVVAAIEYLHEENPGSLVDETGDLVSGSADNHPADIATETVDREIDYSLEGNAERVLGEIDAALQRIEKGTYGRCASCGRDIGRERLEARPWARLCITCQRREESA